MTKPNFKKGDRVRLTGPSGHNDLHVGALGTVQQDDDSYPYVTWDRFTGGLSGERYDGSTCDWCVYTEDMELVVEPSVEAFKIGQRVRSTKLGWTDFEGVVVESNYYSYVAVEPRGGGKFYFYPKDLTSIEPAPTSTAKPECYVTAWADLDGWFYLTEYKPHPTKEAADAHAKALVSEHSEPVAVFKMVSKHSSAVTVTSEDV